MNLRIEVKRKISIAESEFFRKFADDNWGKHYDTPEEVKLCFFAKPDFVLVAYFKNIVVGLVNIYLREIAFNGKKLKIGGIGGMVAGKKFRHQGIATRLLEDCIKLMKKSGAKVSFLSTDIKQLGKLYRHVGFVHLNRPYFFLDKNGVERQAEGGMISPIVSKDIYNKIFKSNEKIFVGKSDF